MYFESSSVSEDSPCTVVHATGAYFESPISKSRYSQLQALNPKFEMIIARSWET